MDYVEAVLRMKAADQFERAQAEGAYFRECSDPGHAIFIEVERFQNAEGIADVDYPAATADIVLPVVDFMECNAFHLKRVGGAGNHMHLVPLARHLFRNIFEVYPLSAGVGVGAVAEEAYFHYRFSPAWLNFFRRSMALSPVGRTIFFGSNFFTTRAGFPATMTLGGTFFVTTAPAPTIEWAPMRTPLHTIAESPTHAPGSSTIGALPPGMRVRS